MTEISMELGGLTYRIVRIHQRLYRLEHSGQPLGEFQCAYGEIQVVTGDMQQVLPVALQALHRGIIPILDP